MSWISLIVNSGKNKNLRAHTHTLLKTPMISKKIALRRIDSRFTDTKKKEIGRTLLDIVRWEWNLPSPYIP